MLRSLFGFARCFHILNGRPVEYFLGQNEACVGGSKRPDDSRNVDSRNINPESESPQIDLLDGADHARGEIRQQRVQIAQARGVRGTGVFISLDYAQVVIEGSVKRVLERQR